MNNSKILTIASIIGVCTTAIISSRCAKKFVADKTVAKNKKEKIIKHIKHYFPAYLVITGTIICILQTERLNQKDKAALLALCNKLQENYIHYKETSEKYLSDEDKEKINKELLNKKQKELLDDKIKLYEVDPKTIEDGKDKKLFYETYFGTFFEKTFEEVLEAEKMLNKQLGLTGFASLSDFYDYLGLKYSDEADFLGWCTDKKLYHGGQAISPFVDFEHSMMLGDDGIEYYYIAFSNEPKVNYDMLE